MSQIVITVKKIIEGFIRSHNAPIKNIITVLSTISMGISCNVGKRKITLAEKSNLNSIFSRQIKQHSVFIVMRQKNTYFKRLNIRS